MPQWQCYSGPLKIVGSPISFKYILYSDQDGYNIS